MLWTPSVSVDVAMVQVPPVAAPVPIFVVPSNRLTVLRGLGRAGEGGRIDLGDVVGGGHAGVLSPARTGRDGVLPRSHRW